MPLWVTKGDEKARGRRESLILTTSAISNLAKPSTPQMSPSPSAAVFSTAPPSAVSIYRRFSVSLCLRVKSAAGLPGFAANSLDRVFNRAMPASTPAYYLTRNFDDNAAS